VAKETDQFGGRKAQAMEKSMKQRESLHNDEWSQAMKGPRYTNHYALHWNRYRGGATVGRGLEGKGEKLGEGWVQNGRVIKATVDRNREHPYVKGELERRRHITTQHTGVKARGRLSTRGTEAECENVRRGEKKQVLTRS